MKKNNGQNPEDGAYSVQNPENREAPSWEVPQNAPGRDEPSWGASPEYVPEKREAPAEREMPKKNRHTGAKVTGGAGAVVILALLFGGLGRGGGNGILPGGNGSEFLSETGSKIEQKVDEATDFVQDTLNLGEKDDGVLSIVVKGDTIIYEGKEVSSSALEEALTGDYKDGVTVSLEDDHAIKGTYDEVTAILDKIGISY